MKTPPVPQVPSRLDPNPNLPSSGRETPTILEQLNQPLTLDLAGLTR